MMGRRSPRRFERQDSRYNARGFIPRRFRKFDFVRLRKCSLDCWTYAYVLAPVGRVVEWDEDKDSRLIVVKATKCARAHPRSMGGKERVHVIAMCAIWCGPSV